MLLYNSAISFSSVLFPISFANFSLDFSNLSQSWFKLTRGRKLGYGMFLANEFYVSEEAPIANIIVRDDIFLDTFLYFVSTRTVIVRIKESTPTYENCSTFIYTVINI